MYFTTLFVFPNCHIWYLCMRIVNGFVSFLWVLKIIKSIPSIGLLLSLSLFERKNVSHTFTYSQTTFYDLKHVLTTIADDILQLPPRACHAPFGDLFILVTACQSSFVCQTLQLNLLTEKKNTFNYTFIIKHNFTRSVVKVCLLCVRCLPWNLKFIEFECLHWKLH